MGKEAKTNAMRMLERAKVNYTSHEYPHEEGQAVDGAHVAQLTGRTLPRCSRPLSPRGQTATITCLLCLFWRNWI